MESHTTLSFLPFLSTGVWGGTAGDSNVIGHIFEIFRHVVDAIGVWGGTAGD